MDLIYLGIGLSIGLLLGYLIGLLKTKNNSPQNDPKFISKEVHKNTLFRVEKLENTLEDKEIECIDLNKVLG